MPLWEPEQLETPRVPTIADRVPVSQIMSRDVVCAREDLNIEALLELIVQRHIGCVPVVDERGRPLGMITKFDLVEQLLAARDPDPPPVPLMVGQVMMPLALTLDERATVAHASAMMAIEDVHHVPIVGDSGSLIGVVSTMDIVRWLAANDGVPDSDLAVTRTMATISSSG
ncbi:MAG TPA: CBS domain-containing protein [Kofleriaceae bacterium]|nr:CBS domain-containing protein [Kofleriaceae bacterium]